MDLKIFSKICINIPDTANNSNEGGNDYEKNNTGNNRAHCISRNWSSKCYINNDVMVG